MFRLLDHSKINKTTLAYLFIVIIYAANASRLVRLYGDIHIFSEGSVLLLLATIFFIWKNHVVFTYGFLKIVGIFLAYAILTTINNGIINLIWIYKWVLGLSIAYSLVQVYGKRLFIAYETILYRLCQISLLFWVMLIFLKDPFTNLISQLSLTPFSNEKETLNILIYSINNFEDSLYSTIKRNAGFAWEPGAFSCFVVMAIFCNILRTNFQLKNNRPLYIFILSVLSSLSTTGICLLALIIVCCLILNRKVAVSWIILPLLGLMLSLPIVSAKIQNQIESNQDFAYSDLMVDSHNDVNRMIAFKLSWDEFMRHPFLGLGGYDDGTYLRQKGYEVVISSGIGNMLAKYGLVMTIVFLCMLNKTTKVIKKQFDTSNAYLLYIPIIGMMFSYNIWLLPLYITFWMYGSFVPNNLKK